MSLGIRVFCVVALLVPLSSGAQSLSGGVTVPAETCGDWEIWCNLKKWGADFLLDLVEVFQDFFYWVVDTLMGMAVYIVSLLPSLDFLVIDWSSLAPWFWFIDAMGLDLALGIYGAALVFRLTRKLFTLGQW